MPWKDATIKGNLYREGQSRLSPPFRHSVRLVMSLTCPSETPSSSQALLVVPWPKHLIRCSTLIRSLEQVMAAMSSLVHLCHTAWRKRWPTRTAAQIRAASRWMDRRSQVSRWYDVFRLANVLHEIDRGRCMILGLAGHPRSATSLCSPTPTVLAAT